MYSLDQELAFATQKVREQRAVIATLQSELAAARQEIARAREALILAWTSLTCAFKPGGSTLEVAIKDAEARYEKEIIQGGL